MIVGSDSVVPGISSWSPFSTAGRAFPQWSGDGRTVYHITEENGRTTGIVAVPTDGSAPRLVLRFDDPARPWHRFGFRVRAGRLFFTLGEQQSDVWAAELRKL